MNPADATLTLDNIFGILLEVALIVAAVIAGAIVVTILTRR